MFLPRNPRLSQSSVILCGLPFSPGIEFWLSAPCLDVWYSVLVDILEPLWKASPVFCSPCSQGLPHYLLRLAPCLLRASRSGARVGSFSFANVYPPGSFAQVSLPSVSRPFGSVLQPWSVCISSCLWFHKVERVISLPVCSYFLRCVYYWGLKYPWNSKYSSVLEFKSKIPEN